MIENSKQGVRVISAGVLLAIAGMIWAWVPVHGLCFENFRSIDTYHVRLVLPIVTEGSAWQRTWAWATEECVARVQVVIAALIAYNIAALIYLRRTRNDKNSANKPIQSDGFPRA